MNKEKKPASKIGETKTLAEVAKDEHYAARLKLAEQIGRTWKLEQYASLPNYDAIVSRLQMAGAMMRSDDLLQAIDILQRFQYGWDSTEASWPAQSVIQSNWQAPNHF